MTKEQIREAANEYASQYWYNEPQHTGVANGFTAGATWAYQHGCIDPDSAELAGYKRGVEEVSRPQEMTDEQIMAVLNAVGYEEHCWIETVRRFIDRGVRDNNEQE